MKNLDTRLVDATLRDLVEILSQPLQEVPKECTDYTGDKYVHGNLGIANLLGCSKTMVWKHRKNGWIEPAIKQRGKKIICDAPLALELFGKK
jgi:hypothetical protein